MCWIGDLNGDGFDDFAVASPWFVPLSPRHGVGRVQVWLGGPVPHATADFELDAPAGGTRFGSALAGLDLNGDGFADLVVSAPGAGASTSRVLVYFGGARLDTVPSLVLRMPRADDRFGAALADGGDVNGDGFEDLLVGAPGAIGPNGASGRVFEFIGGAHPARTPARVFEGAIDGEDFGAAVAGVGDVNGDGRDDFAAGAPLANGGTGAVRLFFGGSDTGADLEWPGASAGEHFGAALARAAGASVLAGAPLDDRAGAGVSGRVDRLTVARYAIDAPASGARWFAGGSYAIRWRGAEPATVSLSLDAGRTWGALATNVVADPAHPLALIAPSTITDSACVRIRPSDPAVPGEAVVPFAITRATQVSRFAYTLENDGIHLTWTTEPGLGPQGWSAWRIYRLGDPPERIGPEAITSGELLVADFERGGTYALDAVDGNGNEVELARVTVPGPATRLAAWPVPSLERGAVQLSVYPPVDRSGFSAADFSLRIYDLNGRVVRRLVEGRTPTRVGEIRGAWDRRTASGGAAHAGVYFLRAESPAHGFRLERRIVLLE